MREIKKKQGTHRREKSKRLIIFCLKFFLIFAILQTIIEFIDLSALNNFLAHTSGALIGAAVNGPQLIFNATSFVVTNSCTGLVSISILAAIIFAFREPQLKKRLALFVLGALLLFAINIPRIALVAYSSALGFDAERVHELTWFLMSAIILIVWFFGTKALAKGKDFIELI